MPSNNTTQQNIKIRGIVTDMQGEPLIGANVLVEGSKQATITDVKGEFSLEVPANSKLRITYIGYMPQEVSVKNKTSFNIQLQEDTQTMDEVVVIGFGTQKKVNMTGSSRQCQRVTGRPSDNQRFGSFARGSSRIKN